MNLKKIQDNLNRYVLYSICYYQNHLKKYNIDKQHRFLL